MRFGVCIEEVQRKSRGEIGFSAVPYGHFMIVLYLYPALKYRAIFGRAYSTCNVFCLRYTALKRRAIFGRACQEPVKGRAAGSWEEGESESEEIGNARIGMCRPITPIR